jgi:cell division protein FtsI/penicillin-binding protein 2
MTREHAMLLSFAGAAILFLILPASNSKQFAFNWPGSTSDRYEAAIDAALQEAANSALTNRDGTIIIMDARTGRVRAIVNPQLAYATALMPGSAMKPFTALAALRAELIDEGSRTVCPGRFTGLNFSLPCVHASHLPPFSPAQAIAHSCNYYFAAAGQRLGRDKLVATLREFDFGHATGISEEELNGVLRPCEIGNSARVRRVEFNGADESDCLERAAVGESNHIQVTPIQLLTAYAALVNSRAVQHQHRLRTSRHHSRRYARRDQLRNGTRRETRFPPVNHHWQDRHREPGNRFSQQRLVCWLRCAVSEQR